MTFQVYEGCISTMHTSTAVVLGGGKHKSVTTPIAVLEPYIPVAWASSDLDKFSPKSAPLLSSGCRLNAAARETASEGGWDGLSMGEKAGVGSGAAAVGIIVLALTALFFVRRKKHGKEVMEMREIQIVPTR